jgi:hypothetical protein
MMHFSDDKPIMQHMISVLAITSTSCSKNLCSQ